MTSAQYLSGNDLSRLLKSRGPLPVPEAVDLVLQASEAIGEAHALGIVHQAPAASRPLPDTVPGSGGGRS